MNEEEAGEEDEEQTITPHSIPSIQNRVGLQTRPALRDQTEVTLLSSCPASRVSECASSPSKLAVDCSNQVAQPDQSGRMSTIAVHPSEATATSVSSCSDRRVGEEQEVSTKIERK
ncbi:hypothetical protein BLNAU_12021 [Blattamonas nauphoetae]|uniref:Uncharacterized protein n=1 Tax=Blattamonas nauphoetae TaxID=2049346 RepID=A0ABQ9XKS5_9EUKA|nr:hypothetical protein BLNAU_12021 [Blattamonas nauphoetae]